MRVQSKRFRIRKIGDSYYVQEKRWFFFWRNIHGANNKLSYSHYNDAYADAVWQCERVARNAKFEKETFAVFYESE